MIPAATKSIIHRASLSFSLITWLVLCAISAEGQPALTQSIWTVDDALSENGAFEVKISPDCHWIVWANDGNLFLSGLTDGKEIQRTQDGKGCDHPAWSADGHLIAFISSRPNQKSKPPGKALAQIWLIKPFEGEPWPITAGNDSVAQFAWSGTNTIIFSMADSSALPKQTDDDTNDNSIVVGDESRNPPVRLFQVNVDSGKVERLTDNTDQIAGFWLSPNGRYLVSVHVRGSFYYDQAEEPLVFLTDLATRQQKQILANDKDILRSAVWERDSRGFYFITTHRSRSHYLYPAIFLMGHYAVATAKIEPVDLDWESGLSRDFYRTPSEFLLNVTEDGFITSLAGGVRPKLARYRHVGRRWQREPITGIHSTNVFALEIGPDDKTAVYQYSDSCHPPQWYESQLEEAKLGPPLQVTLFNPQFQTKPTAKSEIVDWKGALGQTVEGILLYPFDYQPGKKYPLVVDIHGGPDDGTFMDKWYGFFCNNNLLNERGVFVFRPNYHGGANYGLKWSESIIGRPGLLEVKDIDTGVDYLIHRGLVAPDRLAVTGWSQGGFLTAAVTASTHRYRAAVSGDGVVDWIDYWARSDCGGWFSGSFIGGTPMADRALYIKYSPLYRLNRVTTPTLIMFGAEDQRVPVEQGWMYYRALQQAGKANVRFILFPGDGHAPTLHAKRAFNEELAWLDKYLLAPSGGPKRTAEHSNYR